MQTTGLKFQGMFALFYNRELKTRQQAEEDLRAAGITVERQQHIKMGSRGDNVADVFVLQIPDRQDDQFYFGFNREYQGTPNGPRRNPEPEYLVNELKASAPWNFQKQVDYYQAQSTDPNPLS